MLISAGVDYKNTPIELREELSFDDSSVVNIIKDVCKSDSIKGCVILSTCNRTEIYISADEYIEADRVLIEYSDSDYEKFKDKFNIYVDNEVIYHLIETACGLHSAIMREDQIITQVSHAIALSHENKCTDAELDVLFRIAVSAAKKAVSAPESNYRLSSANRAVEMLEKMYVSLEGRKCVIIGNGKVGILVANLLRNKGADVTITLRSYKHGNNIIPNGCSIVEYADRKMAIDGCDILLSATKSPHFTVTSELTKGIKMPKYIIDLAVPRDVEPSVYENRNIKYFNIDNFTSTDSNEDKEVYEIVESAVSEYIMWNNYRNSIEEIENIKSIISKRIIKTTGYDEDMVHTVTDKALDMVFGGIKSAVTPETLKECHRKIKDRSRL